MEEADQEGNNTLSRIENELADVNPRLLDGIPKDKKQQIINYVSETTYRGPLPSPETLNQYSTIIPNGADRIMKMAEKQLEHRINMENKVIGGQLLQSNIGQFLAFLIGIASLVTAAYCIINGHEWPGSLLGIGGLTGLVTAFIKGKDQSEKSLEEKVPEEKQTQKKKRK